MSNSPPDYPNPPETAPTGPPSPVPPATGADPQAGVHEAFRVESSGETQGTSLLSALFEGCPPGHLVLWTKQDTKCVWIAPGDLQGAMTRSLNMARRCDVYFGACLQDKGAAVEGVKRAGNAAGLGQYKEFFTRGTAETVVALSAIWCDLDTREGKHAGQASRPTKEHALEVVASLPLKPSARVATGGGFHLYWFLREPFPFGSEADRKRAREYVEAWQALIREQIKPFTLDNTSDLARLLRLPGTLNHGTTPPGVVVLEDLDPGRRYPLSDFEKYLPAAKARNTAFPHPTRGALSGRGVVNETKVIPHGARNSTLTSLAGSMRYRGLCQSLIEQFLLAMVHVPGCWQETSTDPLRDDEVRTIAESVAKYPPGTAVNTLYRELLHAILSPVFPCNADGRLVLAALLTHTNSDWECWPSWTTLCKETKLTTRRYSRAKLELVNWEVITVESVRGKSNRYVVNVSRIFALCSPPPLPD